MSDPPAKLRTSDSALRGPQISGLKERPSRALPKQPWSPPTTSPTEITSQQVVPPDSAEHPAKSKTPSADEPFQRFYSTFEGLISKLSAPLAFAGLPLGSDAAQADTPHRKSSADTKVDRHPATPNRSSLSTEPDIDKLYSRAALRAIRDNNGGNGNTAESFYVVPTTGGTVSYAGILNRAEKEARRSSIEEADEDFVDARETPSSPELRQSTTATKGSRRLGRRTDKPTALQNPKTMEELQMENQALKHLSDTLSKRLHMWEVNAQSSSMALQQSLKAMHQHNTASPEHPPQQSVVLPTTAPPSSTDNDQRIKELEEAIRRSEKELDKIGRENEKLKNVLGRYRERWEKLKEGAKTRRAEAKNGNDTNTNIAAMSPGTLHTRGEGESPPLQAVGEVENDNPKESDKPELPES